MMTRKASRSRRSGSARSTPSSSPASRGRDWPSAASIRRQLQAAAPRDIAELLPHLQERGERLAAENAGLLAVRARREAAAMREILAARRDGIGAAARRYDDPQQSLDFGEDERRQLEAIQRHWQKRLQAIEAELRTEPARIEWVYEIRARRVEPVGLVYLWPVTG